MLRLPFDPEWGGLGHDALTMVYVLEHLGYGCRDAGLLFTLATQMVSMAIPIRAVRLRRPQGALPAPADRRLDHQRARHLRARGRVGRHRHGNDGERGRRLLRHQRQEGVLHERPGGRRDHRLRDDRSGGRRHGDQRVPRRDGQSRHPCRRADPEDGAEHVADRRARVHRLPRAEGEPDRQAWAAGSSCSRPS